MKCNEVFEKFLELEPVYEARDMWSDDFDYECIGCDGYTLVYRKDFKHREDCVMTAMKTIIKALYDQMTNSPMYDFDSLPGD